jgi:hypothetical protein
LIEICSCYLLVISKASFTNCISASFALDSITCKTPAELAEAFGPLAETIAAVPGMRWKIRSLNEAESEFAGIYLFDDAESVQAYLEGEIISEILATVRTPDN